MKRTKEKIQHLLIKHLLESGEISLKLPDGMELHIGITQEGRDGDLHKVDQYCWLIAEQHERTVAIDSYNLGLRFPDESDMIVLEDELIGEEGLVVKHLDVV